MSSFDSPYFQIDLPPDTVDASSYCFALAAASRFHPSIVIKFDDLPPGQTLTDYAAIQVKKMQAQLKNFKMLVPPQTDAPGQISLSYQWGAEDSRFRQYQIFRQSGVRVFLITGTLLVDGGLQYATLLKDAMRSFRPK